MTRLITVLIITSFLVFLIPSSTFGQNAKPESGQQKANREVRASETKSEKESEEEKRLDRTPAITIHADRETIYALLTKQMKEKGFKLDKESEGVMMFSQRMTGVQAAIRRNSYDRNLHSSYSDDPRTIMIFGVEKKNDRYIVIGRMFVTDIFNGKIVSFDLTDRKKGRISLNKVLERLEADTDQATKQTK